MTYIIRSNNSSKAAKSTRPEWNGFLTDASRFKLNPEEEKRRQERALARPPPRTHWRLERHTTHRVTPPPKFVHANDKKTDDDAADLVLDEDYISYENNDLSVDELTKRIDSVESLLESEREARRDLEERILALTKKFDAMQDEVDTMKEPPSVSLPSEKETMTPPMPSLVILNDTHALPIQEEPPHTLPAFEETLDQDDDDRLILSSTRLW